jgi:hypothetical protein
MGVRDAAAAAVEAATAKTEADRLRWEKWNGQYGVDLVNKLLGLTGQCVSARSDNLCKGEKWGDGTIVRVDDDSGPLFFEVDVFAEWTTDSSGRTKCDRNVSFRLVTAEGRPWFQHPTAQRSWSTQGVTAWRPVIASFDRFTDLVGLADVLREFDRFMAASCVEDLPPEKMVGTEIRFTGKGQDGK